jgi:hypothetical protein|tara:strand:- start:325 stop:528 length:204 start_codon:yes stop_codon:yes gene_type:complete
MSERLKVEGALNFVRDPKSNAIINTDNKGYRDYIARHNQGLRRDEEIKDLKSEMAQIKELLKKILEK